MSHLKQPIQRAHETLSYRNAVSVAAALCALPVVGTGLVACTTSGSPSAVPAATNTSAEPEIRQTDAAGRQLPFPTEFPNRWSRNNDGTDYEPCTQVSEATLRQLSLDVRSVADVAASDFQTARGCSWKFLSDGRSTLSQFVGNINGTEQTLSGYKSLNSAATDWYPDTSLDGRRVLVGSGMSAECAAIVQSGSAVVVTSVIRFGVPKPTTSEICDTAIAFLRNTISEIPV